MKHWKIALCALLCFVLFAAFAPMRAEAAQTATVYLDPAAGNDSADGLTEATAVQSYETAYGKVKANGGTIVLLSTLEITEDVRLPASAGTAMVVLTSKTGDEGISANTNIRFNAPTTLQNMTVTLSTPSSAYMILAEGKKLVIGENVNCVGATKDGTTYYFSIAGGKRWASCASTDLTVQSGTWRNIYVGNYGHKSGHNVTGNAKLTMTGGKLTGFVTPAYTNGITVGSVDIHLSNMSAASMYCAPASSGTVSGDVNVTFGENAVFSGSVYAGGTGSGSVTGAVNFVLDGADTTGYDKLSGGGASNFTGTVGAAKLLLKSGTLGVSPTNFTSVDVDIPAGKTLTVSKCTLTADSVKAAGTLAFSGIAKLTAGAVTGTVSCSAEPLLNNHAYVTAPAGSGIAFADNVIPENNGVWINHDLENFQGLILTAQEGVTTTLYTGFDPESSSVKKVEPYATVGNTKYYPLLQGNYYYRASGTGYYKIKRNIYMSEEKAMSKTVYEVTPGKKSGLGWESDNETVKYFTDEFFANAIPSDKSMWPQFAEIFTTPAFGENRADNQFTTQAEMEGFLKNLDGVNDNMYVYSMGTSGRGQDMPLVLFTRVDLTGKSLEEAAALVVADSKANGKLTIHNQAFIHGNEPAGGEAALGMIKLLDGAYGETLLDSMNIYIMPRMNPDGAQDNLRRIPTWGLKDPNTDYAQLETKEVQNSVRVMNLFQPHIVFDNHEGNVTTTATTERYMGMLVNPRFGQLSNQDFKNLGITMVQNVFRALDEEEITYRYISDTVSSKGMGTVLGYAGNQGRLAFLMESPGILHGKVNYERRVAGHIICLTTFYNYMKENRADVKAIVEAEQQRIIESGKTFEESDIVVLQSSTTEHPEYQITIPNYDGATGLFKKYETITPLMVDKIERSRPAPTAYVIPAGESWVADVMTIMDRHGVEYTKLPAGQTVMLRQYTGSRSAAELTEETAVSFPDGAYVFCMNQQKAFVLSVLLEPDLTDTARTLTSGNGHYTATSGEIHTYIAPVDGKYPIYRYEHDLNAEGFIDSTDVPGAPTGLTGVDATDSAPGSITGLVADKLYEYRAEGNTTYTSLPAGTTEITGLAAGKYYVRFPASGANKASADAAITIGQYSGSEYAVYLSASSGSDTNDGYTEAAAVKTLEKALAQLDALMRTAPTGAKGMLVLLDMYTLPDAKYDFPSYSYPLIITGKTGSEGFSYTGGGSAKTNMITLGGETILQKMTLKLTSSNQYNYICAAGHKLTVGNDVTCIPNSAGSYFSLIGGIYGTSASDELDSTEMVIYSGIWKHLYVGNQNSGKILGDAKLTMYGGEVTNYIQSGYGGTINGNVIVDLANVNVGTRVTGGATYNGIVRGDATLILREGFSTKNVYATAGSAKITGTFTVIVDGADLINVPLSGKSSSTGTVGKSVLIYKSGTLGAYSDFGEFVDESNAVIRGDMNGDGTVSDADAMYLLRYTLFGEGRYPLTQSGDVNGDGTVSDADAMYLLRYTLFGESRYPLH